MNNESELDRLKKRSLEIDEIFQKHNIEHNDIVKKRLLFAFGGDYKIFQKVHKKDSTKYLELIQASNLLKKSIKDNKSISIKSGTLKIELKNQDNLQNLILFIDSLIEHERDGLYQYLFEWEFREPLYPQLTQEDIHQMKVELYSNAMSEDEIMKQWNQTTPFSHFTKPYTDEETAIILNYELLNYDKSKEYQKIWTALRLKAFVAYCRKTGVFDNVKTIRTNEACFLYDMLVYFNIIHEDLSANNQDKYQYIKQELKKTKEAQSQTMFINGEELDLDKLLSL